MGSPLDCYFDLEGSEKLCEFNVTNTQHCPKELGEHTNTEIQIFHFVKRPVLVNNGCHKKFQNVNRNEIDLIFLRSNLNVKLIGNFRRQGWIDLLTDTAA